jgi:ribosomal protein S18 acetylase RimI-like enzyme
MKVSDFIVKPLEESTWQDFAQLVEKHNGVWGGCWCLGFHQKGTGSFSKNKEEKKRRVSAGETHAALVYDGSNAVGWCQFGQADTLPRIKHKRQYDSELTALPDWRITCFFVDRDYRGKGIASIALEGALNEITRLGGGTVESYPEDVAGRSTSGSFLYNAALSIFERQGFQRIRRLGKHHWVVRKVVGSRS